MRILRFLYFLTVAIASAANVPPEVLQQGSAPTLRRGGTPHDLDVQSLFRDPDVTGTVVRISIRIGSSVKPVDIALFDADKPATVANFLAYVNAGRFQNNFMHRSVPGFVVQGGGFRWTDAGSVESVPTYAPVINEPGLSNLRGTIAMAKLGGDPNSATSQWFVNLADNSANLDAQNGGFTVFGRVVGAGMTVIDEIAALPRVNAGSPFDTLPVKDFTGGNVSRIHTVETNAAIVRALNFSAISDDPGLVSVSVTSPKVRFTPSTSRSGTTTVHIHATDLDGATVTMDVPVTVRPKSEGWHVEVGPGGEFTFVYDPANPATITNDRVAVDWGSVVEADTRSLTFTIRNDSGSTLSGVAVTKSGSNAAEFALTAGAAAGDIPSGGSRLFTAALTPGAQGIRSALLRIGGANSDDPSVDLAATGTGIPIPPPVIEGVTMQAIAAGPTGAVAMPDLRGTVVTATDPRGINVFTQTPSPGTMLLLGNHVLSFSATNTAGKTTTAQTSVAVHFNEVAAPTMSLASARTGAPLPATEGLPDGSTLRTFGAPAVSDYRTMASRATITVARTKLPTIYMEDGAGAGRMIAWQGGASGVAGATFKSFLDPMLSPSGKIAFPAKLTGVASGADDGIWTDLFGPLAPILREGLPLPGQPTLKLKAVVGISLTDNALLALLKLAPGPGVVTGASDTVLLRITGINTSFILARTGTNVFGSTVKKLTFLQPAPASPGQGRWHNSNDLLVKLTLADKRVVLAKGTGNGALIPLIQAGAPDSSFPSPLASIGIPSLGGPSISFIAKKAPQAGVTSGNDMVLLHSADGVTFTELLTEGPGLSSFSAFSDPVTNAEGRILFAGTRRAAIARAPATAGLWMSDGSSAPVLVAIIGGAAADANGNALPGAAWSKLVSFALPDGAGPVFMAQMKGKTVTARNSFGLWAVDMAGKPRLLLRTADLITIASGTKQVATFTLLNALPGSFGARRGYTSNHCLGIQAVFTDGTQALLRVEFP